MEQALIDQYVYFFVIAGVTILDSWLSLPAIHGINNTSKWVYLPLAFLGISSGLIGILFYQFCGLSNDINKLQSPSKIVFVAIVYLSLINQKFVTISAEKKTDKQADIGLIAFYSFFKNVSYKVINNIHLKFFIDKELKGVKGKEKDDIKSLKNAAKSRAVNDILTSSEEKKEDIAWIDATVNEGGELFMKKKYLQKYINTGIRFEYPKQEQSSTK
ncbi:MAG: hypothetical protein ACK573_15560 [Pseudanabaena sp.]